MTSRILICLIVITQSSVKSQLINAKEKQTLDHNQAYSKRFSSVHPPANEGLESAVVKLTHSVATLSDRLLNLEENLHFRFQVFGESLAKEKTSIENIYSRLDVLDVLTAKISEVDSKVKNETGIIREALLSTNKEILRLSTQMEELENGSPRTRAREAKFYTKDGHGPTNTASGLSSPSMRNSSTPDQLQKEKEIGEMVLEKVERVLPRLLAAELNYFYLNMATKMDHSIGQLQRELVMRLRRIEGTSKKSLSEIQDGRQDVSHVAHLQRTMIEKQKYLLQASSNTSETTGKCDQPLKESMKELLHEVQENLTIKVVQTIKNSLQDSSTMEERIYRDKGGIAQPAMHSPLWRGLFSKGGSRQTMAHVGAPSAPPKHCLDPTAFTTLEEVKQLLRSLMTKGEDLRRTLTKQANESVDLLKLLHQRFSVLLRRINTDPGHAEALLAEVHELEHLVENSYSSILMAQNVFIESCRRIQQEQPSIEGQIVDILNKLVTNIDLGHQFNRKQLQEVRELIEKMNLEDQNKSISLIPAWMSHSENLTNAGSLRQRSPTFNNRVLSAFLLSAKEANNTKEKLVDVFERITLVESELQSLSWNSGNVKNTVDELLTAAKDLKGYSKDQIHTLQSFQNHILNLMDSISLQKPILTYSKNDSSESELREEDITKCENKNDLISEIDTQSNQEGQCLLQLLNSLNFSSIHQFKSVLLNDSSEEEITNAFKELFRDTINTRQNHPSSLPFPPTPIATTGIVQESSTITPVGSMNDGKSKSNFDNKNFSSENTDSSFLGSNKGFVESDQSPAISNQDLENENLDVENDDQFYYDSDKEEMFMDDDHSWNQFNYYDDEDERYVDDVYFKEEDKLLKNKFSENWNLKESLMKNENNNKNNINKITMLEHDFVIN